MKVTLVFFFVVASALTAKIDLDGNDNLNEEEFEDYFHLPEVTDLGEKLKREEALVKNENLIKETNEEYLNGEITWWDDVNEFSDLPEVDNFIIHDLSSCLNESPMVSFLWTG